MAQIKDSMVRYITQEEIREMTKQICRQIESDYRGKEVVLICPLKGSVLFCADFSRELKLPQQLEFVQLITRKPEGKHEQGEVTIVKDISTNVMSKHVLIVEEIIDAGRTLSFLKNRVLASGPASLKIVTLLDKPARRQINIKADYIGTTIEDRYVVGYGLDEDELGRNYPDIYYLKH